MRQRVQRVRVRTKKKLKRKSYLKKTLVIVGAATALCGAWYWVVTEGPRVVRALPMCTVAHCEVRGAVTVERSAAVRAFLSRAEGVSVIDLDCGTLMGEVAAAFPELRVRWCRFKIPSRLMLSVEARVPVARLPAGADGAVLLIDAQGAVFPPQGEMDELLPELIASADMPVARLLAFIATWRAEAHGLRHPLKKIIALPLGEIDLFLADGTKISWGQVDCGLDVFRDRFSHLIAVLNDARDRFGSIRYVNLRYLNDGRILIRPQKV